MKVAFYYRQGSRSFGCLLPDEKEKLRTFLNTEQKYKPEKELKSNHQFTLALYLFIIHLPFHSAATSPVSLQRPSGYPL